MKHRRLVTFLLTSALASMALVACGSFDPDGFDQSDQSIIYGSDDRHEFYQSSGSAAAALFDAEVALFSRKEGLIAPASGGGYDIAAHPTFSEYMYPLCSSEPYRDQPVPAYCSGFMVGPDLIATAGHCVGNRKECNDTLFVFGFHMQNPSTPVLHVPDSDVYQCAEIVAREETWTNDFSIVRVDRPIVGHQALPVRSSGDVESDPDVDEIAAIGHPVGMPAKLCDNAQVMDASHADYFQANLDVYGGNSGSAVVSLTNGGALHLVEGILVRGNSDWVYYQGCYRTRVCSDSGCPEWEESTRATNFAQYLSSSPDLCGDNTCDTGEGEDCESCPADCGECPPPSECLARGESCTADAECCSGNCHHRHLVCK
jgi:hypothetical protein